MKTMDTIDRREWLYTQSDDAVVAEICHLEAELATTKAELETEKFKYKSLSEHVAVHEGVLKDEVAAMKALVKKLALRLENYVIPDDLGTKAIPARDDVVEIMKEVEGCGPCSVCQAETTYTGEHNGDFPVWLCPDHGGKS